MKKLILSIAFLGLGVAIVNAQAPAAAKAEVKQSPKAEQKVVAPKAEQKAVAPKAETKKADAPSAKPDSEKKTDANGTVLKKDGTPDKRYKGNKESKGPLKKDGTPDKRFKANKEAKPAEKK